MAKIKTEEKGIFPFFSKGAQANAFYFYNPKLVVQGQQKFLSTWGDRPNSDNWAIVSAISSIREESPGINEEEQTKKRQTLQGSHEGGPKMASTWPAVRFLIHEWHARELQPLH